MWTRPIILLGVISFFADVASDMLYPIWPLYLTGTLGASVVALGLIEGLADFISGVLKIAIGRYSDRIGRRRPFVFWGYILAASAKPLTGLSSHWFQALMGRALDRTGKGLRTAPRDAMLSDWAPKGQEGKVFGFHRGMDTLGATVGPLITLGILAVWPRLELSKLFLIAFIPGLIAAFLVLWVPEKKMVATQRIQTPVFSSLEKFPKVFYFYLFVWVLFSLGNSSDVFLILKIQQFGGSASQTILSYCFFNLIYALCSYPLGAWADKKGAPKIFLAGLLIFALVYGIFAGASSWAHFMTGLFLYGLFNAATDGIGKAIVVQLAPRNQKATAIGLFVGLTGFSTLIASFVGGWIWDNFGSSWSFGLSAVLALMAAVIFYLGQRWWPFPKSV
jgi:MFS family permease